jgi:D-3-phosphoglycerate dehydrogenase
VSGTLIGIAQRERIVEVNGFDVDLEPTDHLAFLRYEDRPGMVGTVGGILGDARVNIAGMQVSRDSKGGSALVALSVDSAIPAETLAEIEAAIDAREVRAVNLT